MTEKAKEFMEFISKDDELLDRIKKVQSVEQALEIANEKGYDLTAEDFAQADAGEEISEDELQAVAGGWKNCGCVVAGIGVSDASDGSALCGCAVGGMGHWTDGTGRCVCPVAGGGAGKRL